MSSILKKEFVVSALLATIGLLIGCITIIVLNIPVPIAPPYMEPAHSTFPATVYGIGLLEAESENLEIGTPKSGIVTAIYPSVGKWVTSGEPLFKLDDRDLHAEYQVRLAEIETMKAKIQKLKMKPRPIDLTPLEAAAKSASIAAEEAKSFLSMAEHLKDQRSMSEEERQRRLYKQMLTVSQWEESKAKLAQEAAGTWEYDLDIALAELAYAEKRLAATQVDIERLLILAPIDGEILRINIHLGELSDAQTHAPAIVMGNTNLMQVRVDIDQDLVWRIQPNAKAMGVVRGNSSMIFPLDFVRIEPYIVPKRSLTGDISENVNTRVLQLIYRFKRDQLPLYIGEQIDVFVEAPVTLQRNEGAFQSLNGALSEKRTSNAL